MITATREQIVEQARSWIGTPYRHQGRQKGVAIDCIGFVWGVAAELGYRVDIPSNYATDPSGNQVILGCERTLIRQPTNKLIPGDVVIMWGITRNEPQHFVIVGQSGGRLTLIHAFQKRRRVVEHGWDEFWDRRVVACFRFPGVEA